MLPVNLLNALKQYTIEQKSQPLVTPDAASKTGPQFEPGQKLQGTVQAQVASNVFKVNVSGQLVQMELPTTVRSGDIIPLQVIALQPRLTFSMVNSASPLSTPEQLSSTAKMLSSLSQQSPAKAYVRAAQSSPLWEMPQPPESKQLAGLLHEALSNSGLFYESHQAQWLGGGRSTAQLMNEPQNLTPEQARAVVVQSPPGKGAVAQSNPDKAVPTQSSPGKVVAAGDPAAKPLIMDSSRVSANDSYAVITGETTRAEVSQQTDGVALPEAKATTIPDHLQPLVQQQLNTLETSQMMWQGNIWPGQEMQWEVHEQAQQNAPIDGQRQWVTQIQLDLPNLGPIAATLRLNSAGLSLTLNAETAETRTVLGNASTRLVSALSDAGIAVLSTQVNQNDNAQ